ncbi:MAG: hypothetical protein ACYC56_10050 [Candidatus Aquicultor sp.]
MRKWGAISLSSLMILALALSLISCTKTKQTTGKTQQIEHITLHREMFIGDYDVKVVPEMVSYGALLPALSLKDDILPIKQVLGWFKPKTAVKKQHPNGTTAWDVSGDETGTIIISRSSVSFASPVLVNSVGRAGFPGFAPISKTEAVAQAVDYIRTHGGFPVEAKLMQASPDTRGEIRTNVNGRRVKSVGTIGYSVRYVRELTGMPLEMDSIEVRISKLAPGKYVVDRYLRNWHQLCPAGKRKEVIRPEKAIEIAVKHFGPMTHTKNVVVGLLEPVYYDPQQLNRMELCDSPPSSILKPGWRIRVTGWDAIVDGSTGEIQGNEYGAGYGPASIKAMQKFEDESISAKIPVPIWIGLVKNGKTLRHWSPGAREFGVILHESQNILSKMRPYYEKKADMMGASGDTPFTYPQGGLLLVYGRSNVFFVTDSKLGRDMEEKDFPRDGSCRLEFTRDGYYRIYGSEAFICFNESQADNAKRSEYNKQLYGDDPFTKILINVGGPRYIFTDAIASNDKLKSLVTR